jgi:hypothetical protein
MTIRLSLLAASVVGSLFFAQAVAVRAEHHEGHGIGAPHAMMKQRMERKFQEIDADKDGKISKAEHAAESDKMFAEKDTDKDGFISKEEVEAHWAAKKAKWEERKGSALPPKDAPAGATAPIAPVKAQ